MTYDYSIHSAETLRTPLLIYDLDILNDHADRIIAMAGKESLWPHVKTHKSADLVRLLQAKGIRRFKCATLAEAEMLAACGVGDVLIAYPLVGSHVPRFHRLRQLFPQTVFWLIGDNPESIRRLADPLDVQNDTLNLLIDCDAGMHRTGAALSDLVALAGEVRQIVGIKLRGLHVYDGHHNQPDLTERMKRVTETNRKILAEWELIRAQAPQADTLVMGGTPSFPCHLHFFTQPEQLESSAHVFYSPGTLFINDWGYYSQFKDLPFVPAASVLSKVISTPGTDRLTLDLGYKHLAADPKDVRGVIATLKSSEGGLESRPINDLGLEYDSENEDTDKVLDLQQTFQDFCVPLFQNEEHWVFQMKPGYEQFRPEVGSIMNVIPTHICPTTALYHHIRIVKNGRIVSIWPVSAREDVLSFEQLD